MGAPSGPQLVVGGGTQRLDGGRLAWLSVVGGGGGLAHRGVNNVTIKK